MHHYETVTLRVTDQYYIATQATRSGDNSQSWSKKERYTKKGGDISQTRSWEQEEQKKAETVVVNREAINKEHKRK
jgi:hypothetical protein